MLAEICMKAAEKDGGFSERGICYFGIAEKHYILYFVVLPSSFGQT